MVIENRLLRRRARDCENRIEFIQLQRHLDYQSVPILLTCITGVLIVQILYILIVYLC